MRPRIRLLLACAAFAAVPAPASAQSEAPGDSYRNAIRLNAGDAEKPEPLPAAGAAWSVDTTSYGLQADIFSPPGSGGRQEPNRCGTTLYGKTAWAWLHTAKWVRVDVRASAAFDSVLAVMPFTSPSRPRLSPGSGACVNRSTSTAEDFGDDQPILAPGWYAVQAGGVEGPGGEPAGGRLDVVVKLGEPPRLAPRVSAAGRARGAGTAVNVSVDAPRGARIAFTCARRDCRLPRERTVSRSGKRRYLTRQAVPNGARLELRVTRAGHVGRYYAWQVRRGRLGPRVARCLEPASSRPRTRCDG